jgi:hypothetical protein
MREPGVAAAVLKQHRALRTFRSGVAAATIAATNDNDQPKALLRPHKWRATQAGSVAQRLAPALIVVGGVLTLVWSAGLLWIAYRLLNASWS